MKIAFIGTGKVGAPLAIRLAAAGHQVVLAQPTDAPQSVDAALGRSQHLVAQPIQQAVASAEIVFLATPFAANEAVLRQVAPELAGKVLVDCTNPVGPNLSHGLASQQSGSEFVASLVPQTKVVKAFTIYGFENLEDSAFPGFGVRPAMLFCGNDREAKQQVAPLIADCGFEPVDAGELSRALHLEHMTLLWIKMVRLDGQSPHFVFGALRKPQGTQT